ATWVINIELRGPGQVGHHILDLPLGAGTGLAPGVCGQGMQVLRESCQLRLDKRDTVCQGLHGPLLLCILTIRGVCPHETAKQGVLRFFPPAPLAPNATRQAPLIAGATQERTLFAVTCMRLILIEAPSSAYPGGMLRVGKITL